MTDTGVMTTSTSSNSVSPALAPLEELTQHRINEAVQSYMDRQRSKSLALVSAIVAVFGLMSGLILWSVQSSGKVSGELAATNAVNNHLNPQIDNIREMNNQSVDSAARIDEMSKKTEKMLAQSVEIHNKSVLLDAQIGIASIDLKDAKTLLSNKYKEIATSLASDANFRMELEVALKGDLGEVLSKYAQVPGRVTDLENGNLQLAVINGTIDTVEHPNCRCYPVMENGLGDGLNIASKEITDKHVVPLGNAWGREVTACWLYVPSFLHEMNNGSSKWSKLEARVVDGNRVELITSGVGGVPNSLNVRVFIAYKK